MANNSPFNILVDYSSSTEIFKLVHNIVTFESPYHSLIEIVH